MADGDPAAFAPALEALARAWNRLDPDEVVPWLAEQVRYDSPDTELSLQGKTPVIEYLRRKAERIEAAGESARIHAELGWVPTVAGRSRPCIISRQGEVERAALFLVIVDADGRIERIEVTTRDPDPVTAIGSGIVP